MASTDNITSFLKEVTDTIISVVKVLISPRASRIAQQYDARDLIILGNGPSLNTNIEHDLSTLQSTDCLAVNFAANAKEFSLIKPHYYVLADPHFFAATTHENVRKLIDALNAVTWPMTLFVPADKKNNKNLFIQNANITIVNFNAIAQEGFKDYTQYAFDHQWGMPRPRNVLIPSIMIGIWMGYLNLYLLGADHNWLKTLSVDANNRVVSVQPHFYTENKTEEERITAVYANLKLHNVLDSFRVAFRSYHQISEYAKSKLVNIINCTPGSMIDAFDRGDLPTKKAQNG